jgi:hypothetical protein
LKSKQFSETRSFFLESEHPISEKPVRRASENAKMRQKSSSMDKSNWKQTVRERYNCSAGLKNSIAYANPRNLLSLAEFFP